MLTAPSPATPVMAESAQLFLKRLKNDTAHQHEFLETQYLLAAIMSPTVTVQQYGSYLCLMQSIEQAYEAEVLPLVNFLFPARQFIPASKLISADLKAINYTVKAAPLHPYKLPIYQKDAPFALGFMYVMEGSKLGGKVIYKHIHKTLGFTIENGAQFLANAGADTGKEWMQFLGSFSNFVTTQQAETEAIEGAKQAFSSIYDYYQSNRLFYAD